MPVFIDDDSVLHSIGDSAPATEMCSSNRNIVEVVLCVRMCYLDHLIYAM